MTSQRPVVRRCRSIANRGGARAVLLTALGLVLLVAGGLPVFVQGEAARLPAGETAAPTVTAVASSVVAPSTTAAASRSARTPTASSERRGALEAASAPVVGRLVSSNGWPCSGRQVVWQAEAGGLPVRAPSAVRAAVPSTCSDSDGRFRLQVPCFVRGRLALEDAQLAFETAPPGRAAGGAGLDVGDLVVVAAAELIANVVDPHGVPVASAEIELVRRLRNRVLRTARTDGSGRFVCGGLAPGAYQLVVRAPGLLVGRAAFEVPAAAGQVVVDLQLDAGETVRCMVVDDLGQPVAEARLAATDDATVAGSFEQSVVGGVDGTCAFVTAGTAEATAAIWSPEHELVIMPVSDLVAAGVVRLRRRGRIVGSFVDDTGRGCGGSTVSVAPQWPADIDVAFAAAALDLAWPRDERVAVSDAAGAFVVADVPIGRWRVGASGVDHLPPAPVEVEVRSAVDTLATLRCARGHGLAIRVQHGTGEALAGATVSLFERGIGAPGPGSLRDARVTAADGSATFAALAAGDYCVEVRHQRCAPSGPIPVVIGGADESRTVRVTAGVQVDLNVRSAAGAPGNGVACCVVTAAGPGGVVWRGRTGDDGSVRTSALASGAYVMAALPQARGIARVDVEQVRRSGMAVRVSPGLAQQVELIVPELAIVRGTVTGPTGSEAGAEVRVVPLLGDEQSFFVTRSRHVTRADARGHYVIAGLADGRYRLQFGRPGQPFRFEHELQVVAGQREYTCHLNMRPGAVALTVRSCDGNAIAAACARLTRQATAGSVAHGCCRLHGDASGRIRADELVPGRYELVVQADGHATSTTTLDVGPGAVVTRTMRLAPVSRDQVAAEHVQVER